jgi:hypothetical protein
MSKYDKLGAYLLAQGKDAIPMTFEEIERVVGTKLPKSKTHQAWWSNSASNNVMTKVWLGAGYRTEQVDMAKKTLVFRRLAPKARPPGMAEQDRTFKPAERNSGRHPLIGAMKGTFWIDPEWDLTKPALDPEEWDEIEKNMLAKWDREFRR